MSGLLRLPEMSTLLDSVEAGTSVLLVRLLEVLTLPLSLWAWLLKKGIRDPSVGLLETQRAGKGVLVIKYLIRKACLEKIG